MGNLGIEVSPSVIIKLLNVLNINASVLVLAIYYVWGITLKEREWPSW